MTKEPLCFILEYPTGDLVIAYEGGRDMGLALRDALKDSGYRAIFRSSPVSRRSAAGRRCALIETNAPLSEVKAKALDYFLNFDYSRWDDPSHGYLHQDAGGRVWRQR